jgi:hypothetical protein
MPQRPAEGRPSRDDITAAVYEVLKESLRARSRRER